MLTSEKKRVDTEQINLLAKELILLDPERDNTEIKKIRSRIIEMLWGLVETPYYNMTDLQKSKYLSTMKVTPKKKELDENMNFTKAGYLSYSRRNTAAQGAFADWLEGSYFIPYLKSIVKGKKYVPFIYPEHFIGCIEEAFAYNKEGRCWIYQSDRSSFTSFFMNCLFFKVRHTQDALYRKDYFEEISYDQEVNGDMSTTTLWELYESNEQTVEDLVERNLFDDEVQSKRQRSLFVRIFLGIMQELDRYMNSLTKKEGLKDLFKSFTTYDVCLVLKGKHKYYIDFLGNEYKRNYRYSNINSEEMLEDMIKDLVETFIEYDEQIFPTLFQKLLNFLLYGDINSLHDIVIGQLQDGIDLRKRGKLIADCNETNEVRVSEYGKKYWEFVKQLMDSEKGQMNNAW